MDFKDPKNQKIILVAIVFLLIAYFWYDKMYNNTNAEIADRYSQYEQLLTKLNGVEQKAKNLENLKAEYNDLLNSYRPMETLLPEHLEFSAFLNQIHAAAQATRSVVFELQPLGSEQQEFYDTYNYSVSLATTYHDMGRFLADVANFPFIVNVSKVNLEEYEDLPKKPKLVDKTIQAHFTLTAYNAKAGSKAKSN